MVDLVPKFFLTPKRPEIIFIADRSRSMGRHILMLKSALKVFLKSLPLLWLHPFFTLPLLFLFLKNKVYLLMSPESAQKTPKSVVLRGKSLQGPLELEIPVQKLFEQSKKLHQVAAKKAIQELRGKRGWLLGVKDEKTLRLRTAILAALTRWSNKKPSAWACSAKSARNSALSLL